MGWRLVSKYVSIGRGERRERRGDGEIDAV